MAAEPNWNAAWQSQWRPFLVGKRWYLAPPWDQRPAPEGRTRLDLHPGNYFGNGDHPTTQMCLDAMERWLAPGVTFVDVGCGSGLLCMAAKLLGAFEVSGCDLDAGAIAAAREHLPDGHWHIGSTEHYASASVDVAAANLALGVLEQLEPELFRIVRPGGTLVASGVLKEQITVAMRVFSVDHWMLREKLTSGDWAALLFARTATEHR